MKPSSIDFSFASLSARSFVSYSIHDDGVLTAQGQGEAE